MAFLPHRRFLTIKCAWLLTVSVAALSSPAHAQYYGEGTSALPESPYLAMRRAKQGGMPAHALPKLPNDRVPEEKASSWGYKVDATAPKTTASGFNIGAGNTGLSRAPVKAPRPLPPAVTYSSIPQPMPPLHFASSPAPVPQAPMEAAPAAPMVSPPIVAEPAPMPAPVAEPSPTILPPPPAPLETAIVPTPAPVPLAEPSAALPDYQQVSNPAPITPQPVIAPAPLTPMPVAADESGSIPTVPVIPAEPGLSPQSKAVLAKVPSGIDSPAKGSGKTVTMERVNPNVAAALKADAPDDVQTYNQHGINIEIRRPGVNINRRLEQAYEASQHGESDVAISIYQEILSARPDNVEALFGLASTYHQTGRYTEAQALYERILTARPDHREALNNYLVLVGNESPADALQSLSQLQERNPDFSPIPAQMAILYDKLGNFEAAQASMIRAIDLAPDNLAYRYNFAVMLDRRGQQRKAAQIYRSLLKEADNGAALPASTQEIQKRLTFIDSNK